jgi:hypothetical protein
LLQQAHKDLDIFFLSYNFYQTATRRVGESATRRLTKSGSRQLTDAENKGTQTQCWHVLQLFILQVLIVVIEFVLSHKVTIVHLRSCCPKLPQLRTMMCRLNKASKRGTETRSFFRYGIWKISRENGGLLKMIISRCIHLMLLVEVLLLYFRFKK